MRCPYCQSRDTRVTDTRAGEPGIRRRRECGWCGERFTTIETVQRSAVQVVKRDGRREEFQPEKLLAGLRTACRKRPVASDTLEGIVAVVEAQVAADGRAEVPATEIGELAMEALKEVDHIAYIRFASVYRSFADLDSLMQAVDDLQSAREGAPDTRQLALLGEGSGGAPEPIAAR